MVKRERYATREMAITARGSSKRAMQFTMPKSAADQRPYPQKTLPYREFEGEGAPDQAGLVFVAQETADEHNRIELVLGEP